MTRAESAVVFTEELYHLPQPLAIALDRPWNTLAKKEVEFLSRIASSIKLSLAHIQIIDSRCPAFQQRIEKPGKLVGFGIIVPGAGLYELVSLTHTQLVLADRLPLLMEDEGLKKKLWIALQQLMTN